MTRDQRILIGLAALGLGTSACSLGFPEGATTQGRDTHELWQVFTIAAAAVAGIVYALIAWSLIRYRRRRTDAENALGRQFHEHGALEVAYTVIPVLIVAALFALSVRTDDRVTQLDPSPAVVLHVDAFSWGWRFEYVDLGVVIVSPPASPDEPGATIMLPADVTTRVVLESDDVVHAFWIPDFNFKRDAIPGHTNEFDLTPNETGTFRGLCSEFCGLRHTDMTFEVTVADRPSFDEWINEQQGIQASIGLTTPSPASGATP